MKFTCAQRGCEFEAKDVPELCPVCKNPFVPHSHIGPDPSDVPWSEYSVDELREYCESWGIDLEPGRIPKAALIAALELAESLAG